MSIDPGTSGGTGEGSGEYQLATSVVVALVFFAFLFFAPVTIVVFMVTVLWADRSWARPALIALSGVAVFVISSLVALIWSSNLISLMLGGFNSFRVAFDSVPAVGWVNDQISPGNALFDSLFVAFIAQIPFAVSAGLILASMWVTFRRYQQLTFQTMEDKVRIRRPNWWERRRFQTNLKKLSSGGFTKVARKSPLGIYGMGVGNYGKAVLALGSRFVGPLGIFGMMESGKTQLANNLLVQAMRLGSAVLMIDMKGELEYVVKLARAAKSLGRPFYHFWLTPSDGRRYVPVIEGAPDQPASYDPFRNGNASTRAVMLIDAIPRKTDAGETYINAQRELAQVIFQVAEWTGYGQGVGTSHALKRKSGFQIAADLSDLTELAKWADTINVDQLARGLSPVEAHDLQQQVAGVRARITRLTTSARMDEMTRAAINDLGRTSSSFLSGPAAGPYLRPAPAGRSEIDLFSALQEGAVVAFSLSVQDNGAFAQQVGNLTLLDLGIVITRLRSQLEEYRRELGDPDAQAPWDPIWVCLEEFGAMSVPRIIELLNKSRDVKMRFILSSQSPADLYSMDPSGTFAKTVINLFSNIVIFQVKGDGAQMLADVAPEERKLYSRNRSEWKAGLFGIGRKASRTGDAIEEPVYESRLTESQITNLPKWTYYWIASDNSLSEDEDKKSMETTHTYAKPSAGRWAERIRSYAIDPEAFEAFRPENVPEGIPDRRVKADPTVDQTQITEDPMAKSQWEAAHGPNVPPAAHPVVDGTDVPLPEPPDEEPPPEIIDVLDDGPRS
jgi:hypothetical protein